MTYEEYTKAYIALLRVYLHSGLSTSEQAASVTALVDMEEANPAFAKRFEAEPLTLPSLSGV